MMPLLRVAKSGLATVHELQTVYSYTDLADMLEYLDFISSCEAYHTNKRANK